MVRGGRPRLHGMPFVRKGRTHFVKKRVRCSRGCLPASGGLPRIVGNSFRHFSPLAPVFSRPSGGGERVAWLGLQLQPSTSTRPPKAAVPFVPLRVHSWLPNARRFRGASRSPHHPCASVVKKTAGCRIDFGGAFLRMVRGGRPRLHGMPFVRKGRTHFVKKHVRCSRGVYPPQAGSLGSSGTSSANFPLSRSRFHSPLPAQRCLYVTLVPAEPRWGIRREGSAAIGAAFGRVPRVIL